MTTNRILQYICPCAAIARRLDALRDECQRIEAITENAVEFCIPSLARYLDGDRDVHLLLLAEPSEAVISDDLDRFALHLRELLDQRGLSAVNFVERLNEAGLKISQQTALKWISGYHVPHAKDMETIGRVLSLADYRFLLPPPM